MEESILDTIKQTLGIEPDDTDFDTDILININAAFSSLWQIGIGPSEGYMITDSSSTWSEYLSNISQLSAVKLYIYDKTRLNFDPPTNSFIASHIKEDMDEHFWRLSIMASEEELSGRTTAAN